MTHFSKETFWPMLIGSPSIFSLESRVFHSISIALMVLGCIYVPYNLYAGLYIGSVSALVLSLFFFYQYYYSRFQQKQHNSTAFALAGILIFGVNYFANSGIHGSTDLIWPAYLLLVFAISPYNQHLKWLIVYILLFFIMHLIEHVYPELVKHPFIAGKGQFIDRVTAFPIPVFATYIIIRYLRKSYDMERKAAEDKTLAVELSNMEKNKLMSILSHDLRTPLLNVKGYLEMLNDNQIDGTDRHVLEKTLLNATNNAMDMLSNLLHWSKSQMDGKYAQLKSVELHATLVATLEMEKLHALKKDIVLNYQIPAQLSVVADVDMLQLVVRNLVSNAIKFTPTGGEIQIQAQLLDTECKITVNDNGTGIAQDKQPNIFSIRSESAIGTNDERGVGLGLFLCKEYIELQHGRIGFKSSPGQGSSFFIFIPVV